MAASSISDRLRRFWVHEVAAYGASKAGVLPSRNGGDRMGRSGVCVTRPVHGDANGLNAALLDGTDAGREFCFVAMKLGQLDELAGAAVFLGPMPPVVTGHLLVVDGDMAAFLSIKISRPAAKKRRHVSRSNVHAGSWHNTR